MAGISRSATLVLAYLMKYTGVTLKKAFSLISAKRPRVTPKLLRSTPILDLSANSNVSSKVYRQIWKMLLRESNTMWKDQILLPLLKRKHPMRFPQIKTYKSWYTLKYTKEIQEKIIFQVITLKTGNTKEISPCISLPKTQGKACIRKLFQNLSILVKMKISTLDIRAWTGLIVSALKL